MNPLCQCGCGREVRLPTNKYVQGHVSFRLRKLTDEQVVIARRLRDHGLSQAKVAKLLGTTQTTICYRVDGGLYVSPEKHSHEVITEADLEFYMEKQGWKKAGTLLRKTRRSIGKLRRPRLFKWRKQ
jgi:hypothetical protein